MPPILKWWSRRDSNPHALRHTTLNRACLPIPPLDHRLETKPLTKNSCFCLGNRNVGKVSIFLRLAASQEGVEAFEHSAGCVAFGHMQTLTEIASG
jgi:hypothetical protein